MTFLKAKPAIRLPYFLDFWISTSTPVNSKIQHRGQFDSTKAKGRMDESKSGKQNPDPFGRIKIPVEFKSGYI